MTPLPDKSALTLHNWIITLNIELLVKISITRYIDINFYISSSGSWIHYMHGLFNFTIAGYIAVSGRHESTGFIAKLSFKLG